MRGLVGDEHPLDVEFHASRRLPVPQIERRRGRHIEQARVIPLAFHPVMTPDQWVGEIVGDVLVELDVLVVFDLCPRPRPQRLGLVHGFPGILFLAGGLEPDGESDVVGILPDQVADPVALEKLLFVGLERQADGRSAPAFPGLFECIAAVTIGYPTHRVLGGGAGPPAQNLHPLGDDEGRIEAHTELANERGILPGLAVEALQKSRGTRVGDGAQLLDDLLAAHADAVVADGQNSGFGIQRNLDGQFRVGFQELRIGQGFEAQPVVGVGRVGNEFAEKYFLVAVQRVHHEVQQLLHLGLEIECG